MAEVNGIGAVSAGMGVMPVADMSAGSRVTRTQETQNTPDVRKAAEESSAKRQQLEQESQEKRQRILENVISTSKDGDTVQASKEAIEQLKEDEEDGRVLDKNSLMAQKEVTTVAGSDRERTDAVKEAKEEAEARKAELEQSRAEQEARREKLAAANEKILDVKKGPENETEDAEKQERAASFNSYSDAQLKEMYLKGDISRQSYEQEVEKRDSKLEETQKQNAEFQKEGAQNAGRLNENARDAVEIKNLESPDSTEEPDAMMRAMVLQSLDANAIFNENQ